MSLGVHLTLLAGATVPLPPPVDVLRALTSVEVRQADQGRSGFQLVFEAGRAGLPDLLEERLLRTRSLKPWNRVILISTFGLKPKVIMDGVITQQEMTPGDEPGSARLTVTGEDLAVLMDREERTAAHPAQPDAVIVAKLLLRYARYGVVPIVVPPKVIDPPLPTERIPVQTGTDLAYIERLGERHGHVFYVDPGPFPFQSKAYWGPPRRVSVPQKALSVNLGPVSNVTGLNFQQDGMAPVRVEGRVQDRRTDLELPVRTFGALQFPLSARPNWLVDRGKIGVKQFRCATTSAAAAYGQAQARTDRSTDRTVVATGELDCGIYGGLLESRRLVGLRGAGWSYDGLYYVQEVTHKIRWGAYSQSFTLIRDGSGSTVPVVRP